jgi:DNA-binding transcriptional ArsR family regulator
MAMREAELSLVYGAIADPTRRAILAVLARGDASVGGLAGRFPISFNGVSKHVKVLERAGLVDRTIRGREHHLHLRAAPLREAAVWLEHYRGFWEGRLEALEAFLAGQAPSGRRAAPRSRARRG